MTNYPSSDHLVTAARVALFFTLLFSYPVLLHPTRSAINRLGFFLLETWQRRKVAYKVGWFVPSNCLHFCSLFLTLRAQICKDTLFTCVAIYIYHSEETWRNQGRQSYLLIAGATSIASTPGEMSGGCFRGLHQ